MQWEWVEKEYKGIPPGVLWEWEEKYDDAMSSSNVARSCSDSGEEPAQPYCIEDHIDADGVVLSSERSCSSGANGTLAEGDSGHRSDSEVDDDSVTDIRSASASVMSQSATSDASSITSSSPATARRGELQSACTSRTSWLSHESEGSKQPDSICSDRATKPPEPKIPDSPISVASTDAGATCCQRCRAPSCSPGTDSSAACLTASLEDPSTGGESDLIHVHRVMSVLTRDVECIWRVVVPPATSTADGNKKRPIPRQNARLGSPTSSSANISEAPCPKAHQQQSEASSTTSSRSSSLLQPVLLSRSTQT